MVADSDHPSIPARRLAERLRDLREREHRQLTQKQLAKALGGTGTAQHRDDFPLGEAGFWIGCLHRQRLGAYARLFCTRRSFTSETPRLLRDEELTEQERETGGGTVRRAPEPARASAFHGRALASGPGSRPA